MKNFRVESEFLGRTKKDDWDCFEYKTTLKYGKKQMTVPYYQGLAHGTDPSADDVAYALLSDTQTIEYSNGFEDWADSLGYDRDSRKAEKIYKQCEKQAEKFKKLVGSDYPKVEKKYENY